MFLIWYLVLKEYLILVKRFLHFEKQDTQPAITCSKLTREILEKDVKYVQS